MKENKRLIIEAIAFAILLVSALIIWVNTILREKEKTFKQEPLTASQVDAMMMEWNGYENVYKEIGTLQSEDIYKDNMIKGAKYTAKGRLITNNLNE
jgi:p-aminobenzoyl-glutamate transporter AbgT